MSEEGRVFINSIKKIQDSKLFKCKSCSKKLTSDHFNFSNQHREKVICKLCHSIEKIYCCSCEEKKHRAVFFKTHPTKTIGICRHCAKTFQLALLEADERSMSKYIYSMFPELNAH